MATSTDKHEVGAKASPTKSKEKDSSKMHRRSRSGKEFYLCLLEPILILPQAASPADSDARSAMKGNPSAKPAVT
jgi:hypothetical protein